MFATFYPLIGAGITIFSSGALGTIFLRKLDIKVSRGERRAFAFLTGAAWLSILVLGLAALHLIYKGVFYALAGLLLIVVRRTGRPSQETMPNQASRGLVLLALAAALPFFILYLFTAWAPEVSPDGSSYHLGNVLQFAENHALVPIRDMYGALPEGLEMLFLSAFSIGSHAGAALVHFAFLLVLPVLMMFYARRFGFANAGVLAAFVIFASPLFGKDGVSAYNDVALAAATFGTFYMVELWRQERDDRFLIPAGLLAGFCFGIKYTGCMAAIYVILQIAFRFAQQRRMRWMPILLFAAPCFLMIAPWLIKNAVYMHNPFSPFLNAIFPNPYASPMFERDYARNMAFYARTRNPRELVLEYTLIGNKVQGFFGPIFLLAPLSLGSLGRRQGRRLLFAALLFALPVLSNQGARFLLPAMPFLAMALALAIANTKFLTPALLLLHGFASWPSVAAAYCGGYAWRLVDGRPPMVALHPKGAEAYLRKNLPGYDLAVVINQITPPGSRIFCFSCPPQAYTKRELSQSYEFLLGTALDDMLKSPVQEWRPPLKHLSVPFPRVTVTRLRVELPNPGPNAVWTVHELRILDGGNELTRSPAWRIRAWPDPWEAPFAFDNNPASRWSAERYGFDGGFLEVGFNEPTAADAIELEEPLDGAEQIRVLGETAPGRLTPLKAIVHVSAQKAPAGLRRAAVLMLERYGYQYLAIFDTDYAADDYAKYAAFWGMRAVSQGPGWTLYHLE